MAYLNDKRLAGDSPKILTCKWGLIDFPPCPLSVHVVVSAAVISDLVLSASIMLRRKVSTEGHCML